MISVEGLVALLFLAGGLISVLAIAKVWRREKDKVVKNGV